MIKVERRLEPVKICPTFPGRRFESELPEDSKFPTEMNEAYFSHIPW